MPESAIADQERLDVLKLDRYLGQVVEDLSRFWECRMEGQERLVLRDVLRETIEARECLLPGGNHPRPLPRLRGPNRG